MNTLEIARLELCREEILIYGEKRCGTEMLKPLESAIKALKGKQ